MTEQILKCLKCGKYTLESFCECGGECLSPKPPKFSPEDKYAQYRLQYKKKTQDL